VCGLIAAIGRDAEAYVKLGLSHLKHRGTDEPAYISDHRFAVGHVRLPIVGLDTPPQPRIKDDHVFAFVGEVLDFKEYRPDLECDTDFALDAFLRGGPSCLQGHDGFWNFVVYEEEQDCLHVVVDYLAQKPCYIRLDISVVCSELEPLRHLETVSPDPVYFAAVMKWGYCPEPWRTPYREVVKVPPGSYVRLDSDGSNHATLVDALLPTSASPVYLKGEIELAVRRRVMSSDVPVACLLSGGLDSAIAYTLAKRYGDVQPFHVENGETESMRRMAPELHPIALSDVDLYQALGYMQEPVDLGSLFPQVALSYAVGEQKIRVCLTGDGADELFGGYGRAARYDSQASDVWHELVNWHLPRLDRVMMRNRIEVRSPFLARKVVAIALALPWSDRAGDKSLLRDLFCDDLPPGVADTPKRALRTKEVETNREARSADLIRLFKEQRWD
jgi:asparagine synthase (glutamine-hydrolysing)